MWRSAPFYAVLAVVCISVYCPAQVRFGVKGGAHLADIVITNFINPDVESEYDLKGGIHAGLFADIYIHQKVRFGPEILYSNRGVNATGRVNLHYFHIPLLVRFEFAPRFELELGPDVGYLFAAKSQYGDISITWNNKVDLGADVGLIYLASENVYLSARYYAGFSSVINATDGSQAPPEPVKYQNRVLGISLYWVIGDERSN